MAIFSEGVPFLRGSRVGETPPEFYYNSGVAFLQFRPKQDTERGGVIDLTLRIRIVTSSDKTSAVAQFARLHQRSLRAGQDGASTSHSLES